MENSTKKSVPRWIKITAGIVVGLFIIGQFSKTDKTDQTAGTSTSSQPAAKEYTLNQWMPTEYFSVMVKAVKIVDHLTIDELNELKREEGNKYLIVDIALKNTDKESRLMFDGEITTADGKSFEQTETVMAEGYGIMDNINPGVQKNTKLVYKIPADLSGKLYYHPARSSSSDRISLGGL
jgi:hypothetical protein